MARILVTGSTTGLGLAAGEALLAGGHDVVLHARSAERAADLGALSRRAAAVVIGDLADLDQTRRLADDVNALAPLDAVIHNAGIYTERAPNRTAEGHPRVLAVNVLAPYVLSARIRPPSRLIYLSSGMHTGGRPSLDDLDWRRRRWNGMQAYSDSKLLVTALALAIARRWPNVGSNAVDPGWVPTRMGGPGAPDDLDLGYETQVWLATSEDPAARVSGRYWYHRATTEPARVATEAPFQDELLAALAAMTGEPLRSRPQGD
jgi:NAD(P)-dependent dehydrogenase (short-subunit alcohol dehydrogenase family)